MYKRQSLTFERSFASHERASCWSDKNPDKPRDCALSSAKKRWFDCYACSHSFETSLANVSYSNNWCPYCSGRRLCGKCNDCLKRSFATHERASRWSDKNQDKPMDCAIQSGKKKWFDCDVCNHSFESSLDNIVKGNWCPYCIGKKRCNDLDCNACFERSFASHEKASCWSDKNSDKPRDCARSMNEKRWFECDVCNHSFESNLNGVSQGGWCPFCAGITRCKDATCDDCFKRSFASHERASCWSDKNPDKPRDCARSMNKKRWFDCDVCSHSFESLLSNVSNRGRWCPHCVNKTETKLYDYIKTVYPTTEHQFKVEWCKKQRYLPYDFCIPDLKIIIELDGAQHFRQVSNWKSPEETLENDLYKERCATDNEYNVIRLLQEDVWNDRYDWKTKLTSTIEDVKNDTETINVNYICEYNEYDNYLTL